jgi:hypothetical protein
MAERARRTWGARVDAVRRVLRRLRAARGQAAPAASPRTPRQTAGTEPSLRALFLELQRTARPLLAEAAAVSPRRVRLEPDLPQPAMLHLHQGDGDGRGRWSMSFSPAALSRRGPAKTRALADSLRRQLARERAPISTDRAAPPPDLLALLEARFDWSPRLTRLDRWSEDFFSRMDRFLDTVLSLHMDERFELRTVDQLPDLIFEEPRGAVGGARGGSPVFAGPGSALPGVGSAIAAATPSSGGWAPVSTGASLPRAAPVPVSSWSSGAASASAPSRPSAVVGASHSPLPGWPLPAGPFGDAGRRPFSVPPGLSGRVSARSGSPSPSARGRVVPPSAAGSSLGSPVVPGDLLPIGSGWPRGTVKGPAVRLGAGVRRPHPSIPAATGASVALRGGMSTPGPRTPRPLRRGSAYSVVPVPPPLQGISGSPIPARRAWVPLTMSQRPLALARPPRLAPVQRGFLPPFPERHHPLAYLDPHRVASLDDHQDYGVGTPPASMHLEGAPVPLPEPHVLSVMPRRAPHRPASMTALAVPAATPALMTPAMLPFDDVHAARRPGPRSVLGVMPRTATAPGLLRSMVPTSGMPMFETPKPQVATPSGRSLPRLGPGLPRRLEAPSISRTAETQSPRTLLHRPMVMPLSRGLAGGAAPDAHSVRDVIGRAPFRPLIFSDVDTPTARSTLRLPYTPSAVKRLAPPHATTDHRVDREHSSGAAAGTPVPGPGALVGGLPRARHAVGDRTPLVSTLDSAWSRPLGGQAHRAHALGAPSQLGHAPAGLRALTVSHRDAASLPNEVAAVSSHAAVASSSPQSRAATAPEHPSGVPVAAMIPAITAGSAASWPSTPVTRFVPTMPPGVGISGPAARSHVPWVTPWTVMSPIRRSMPILRRFDPSALGGVTSHRARWVAPAPMHAFGPSALGIFGWSPRAAAAVASAPVAAGLDHGWPPLAGAPGTPAEMRYVMLSRPPEPTSAPRHESHVVIDSARSPVHVGPADDDERRIPVRMFRAETGRDHRPEPSQVNGRPNPVDEAREMRPQLPDLDRLAVNVFARIKRQLAVERERRGLLR